MSKYRLVTSNGVDSAVWQSPKVSKAKAETMRAAAVEANERAVRQYTDKGLPVPARLATAKAEVTEA